MHSLDIFLQLQSWYANDINPLDLVCDLRASNLFPIDSDPAAPPEKLLNIYLDCQVECKDNSAGR